MTSEFSLGKLEIRRRSQYFARLRMIDVFVDDAPACVIANGESKILDVRPGRHKIHAKIDWCKTPPLTVDVLVGRTLTVELGSEITTWKLLFTIFYLFMPSRMIYLKELPDLPNSL